jgi:membrane protease YdiL (CAAX protease family)
MSEPDRGQVPNAWPVLLFCMSFPTLMSWLETYWILPALPDEGAPWVWELFLAGKLLQFATPFLFVAWAEPSRLRVARFSRRGVLTGVYFALAGAVGTFVLYYGFLRGSHMLSAIGARTHLWLERFGFDSVGGFLTFAVVISVPHSLLEEYYWRWFVFGWLRQRMSFRPAALISALAFTSHHVLVLNYFLPGYFWVGSIPLALSVALGGVFWAWLYERHGNFYALWISHLLVDAIIMGLGWDMVMESEEATR